MCEATRFSVASEPASSLPKLCRARSAAFTRGLFWTSALALLAISTAVQAQSPYGGFRGIVVDASGSPRPGAAIEVVNLDTGLRRHGTSTENGSYWIPLLPPGRYGVTATQSGSTASVKAEISLSSNQEVVFDPVLLPTVEERIDVTATPLLEPTRSRIGTTLVEEIVQSIPVDARDVLNLGLLSPGALPGRQGGYDGQVEVAVGGLMGIDNTFALDGSLMNDPTFGFPITPLPLDAVAEFQFLTHRYGPEVGGGSGGAMNLVTRSGTNEFHGGAFLFYRDESFNANDPFAPAGVDEVAFDRGQQGFTVGGPIARDRSHFFVAYDGSALDQTQFVDTAGTRPELEIELQATTDVATWLAKGDLAAGPSRHLTFRYNRGEIDFANQGFGPSFTASARFGGPLFQQAAEIADLWAIDGSRYNELRVQYFNGDLDRIPNSSDPLEIRPSSRSGGLRTFPYHRDDRRLQLAESFSWYRSGKRGGHVVRLGGEVLRNRNDTFRTLQSAAGVYLFETDARFEPADGGTFPALAIFGYSEQEDRTTEQAALYAGDDWTATPRLTLNLGLRWDFESGSINDDIPNPVPYLDQPSEDRDNLSPRLGFAYELDGSGRSVLRGGYGRYYTRLYGILDFTGSRGTSGVVTFVANPDYLGFINPSGSAAFAEPSLVGTSPDIEIPYSHQFSIGLDRGLGRRWAASVDYVGMRGHLEVLQIESNPIDSSTGQRAHPEFGSVPVIDSIGSSSYDGLQFWMRSGAAAWGRLGVAYTLSRARNNHTWFYDFVQSEEDLDELDGYSLNDQTHRLVANGVWNAPWRLKLGGVLTLASGQPYNVITGEDADGDGNFDLPPGGERNGERVDGFYRLDLRLSRLVEVGRATIEVIVEGYNVLNRTNVDPDTVNGNLASPGYGEGGSTQHPLYIPRQTQVGVRVAF